MKTLNQQDYQLIEEAKKIINQNYDGETFNHTVGAALKSKNGKIYLGVNVYSVHGACAEMIALGTAITNGEREFTTIVSVNGENNEVMSPCGNCRQLMMDYMPNCDVIIKNNDKLTKVKASELIPFAYHAKY